MKDKHIMAKLVTGELVIGIKVDVGEGFHIKNPRKIAVSPQGATGLIDLFIGLGIKDEEWFVHDKNVMIHRTPDKDIIEAYESIGKKVQRVKPNLIDIGTRKPQ